MADPSTLFEYQITDDGGALIIRVGGAMISGALGQFRQQGAAAQISLSSLMSPLSSIERLFSPAAAAGGQFQQVPVSASPSVPAAHSDWLSQELAQSFEDFQNQIAEFRAALEEIRTGGEGDGAGSAEKQDTAQQ
jgi:hypothetical protein